jgi:hypothetical protein
MTHHHNPKRLEFFAYTFRVIFFFTKSMGYDVFVGVISGLLASIQGPCSPRRGLL